MTTPKEFHCGTLKYTTRGLVILFAWLMWADVCFTLMEAVVPNILPLRLKALGAPDWLLAVIMTTLPSLLNMTVCPWVSFQSDRFRSKWGRRIPFILFTIPMLSAALVGMGWTDDLTVLAHQWLPGLRGIAPATVSLALLAFFMVAFSFFNMYVNSVFWYLFNDIVPAQFLGRFYGLFRIVGTLSGVAFNLLIFPHAETHMREIFTGAALLYFIGFGVVCFRVKEGEYPPPPPAPEGSVLKRFAASINTYRRECYTHRFYWLFYLSTTFAAVAGCIGIFQVFFNREMGLDLAQIGLLGAVSSGAGVVAMYFAAIYVDRWHPLRITTYITIFAACTGFGGWIWLPVTVPVDLYMIMGILGTIITVFSTTLGGNAAVPIFMRLMPPSRYGQFCSAASIIRSLGMLVGGIGAGVYFDVIKSFFGGSDFAYRFNFIWVWVFTIVSAIFTVACYREWKRLGGDMNYRAPAPWSPDGFEDMSDKAVPVSVSTKWLMVALRIFTANNLIYLLSLPVFLVLFHQRGMAVAFWWTAVVYLPLATVLLVVWLWQVRRVRGDIAAVAAGKTPKSGVPHHGVTMVMAVQSLLSMPIVYVFVGWTMALGMEHVVVWYGAAKLLGFLSPIVFIQILRFLEKEPAGDEVGDSGELRLPTSRHSMPKNS